MSIKKTREAKRLIESMAPEGEFLAFINDREAQMLKDAGGSGIMTAAGIPSFVVFSGPEAGGRSAADVLGASAFEGTGGTGEGDSNIGQSPDTRGGINVAPTPKTLGQRIKDFFTGATRFSPTKAVTSGLGFLFDKLGTFANKMRGGLTQAEFERARDIRRAQKSIQNILGRENIPFTELTQDRLNQLAAVLGIDAPQVIPGTFDVVGGPRQDDTPIVSSDSLINRDPRLDGSFTLNIPQSGIVTQAPKDYRFTDAMAQLNLERGVPRDQVFLSAKDFIDPSKTISSEDLGTIQSRMARSAGVPESAIQLTKNYTKEDMEKLGADTGIFGANDQLEALQDYYEAAMSPKVQNSLAGPRSPAEIRDYIDKAAGVIGLGIPSINMDLVPKDFLETQQDFKQQKSPFELFGK